MLRTLWSLFQVGIVAFALLLLGVRYIALPRLERSIDEVTRVLSQQIGQPVEIGSLYTGWDGWNPRVDINGFRILNRENGTATVTLPHVHLVAAWTSLIALDLRLKELTIVGLQLSLKRDLNGMLHVAGITIDPLAANVDRRLVSWVMRQPNVVVHNAELAWRDEHAGGSGLTLSQVELRLENRFGHHRFGLTGAPPPEISAPVDLRGDFTGTTFADARALTGRVYARLDYADIAAWREWLPMTTPIRSGKGAVRFWLEVEQGELRDLVADVVLADVDARLAPDLPELGLTGLDGRLGWSNDGKLRVFSTRQLTFVERSGVRFDPTDFKLTMRAGIDGPGTGQIEFARLELTPLRQIAASLPLPVKWREDLARVAPSGTLEGGTIQWRGDLDALQEVSGSGRFIDLGFAAQGGLPGVTGATGTIDASPQGGTVKFDSRGLTLDMPRALGEKMAFDSVQAQARWHQDQAGLSVDVDQLAFANRDLAGTVKGSVSTGTDGRTRADMTGQITRAEATQIYRYLPVTIDNEVREWMRRAIRAGTASNLRIRVAGVLAEFPFADGRDGQFLVQARAQGLTLDYLAGWPAAHDLEGDIHVEGVRFTADVGKGRIFAAELGQTKIDIADLRAANPVLRINGSVTGQSSDFIRYIVDSPLDVTLDHPLAGIDVGGAGRLTLNLELPLGKPDAIKVSGEYAVENGRVQFSDGTPPLERVSGKIQFSGREVTAPALIGELLGGPAHFVVGTPDGRLHVDGQGSIDLALLRTAYPKLSLLTRVSGNTDWKVAVNAQPGGMAWVLDSSLKGAIVDLPAPVGKSASEALELRVERRVSEPGRDVLMGGYGKLASFVVERKLAPTGATAERGLLALGGGPAVPDRQGFWIRGSVDALDADAWIRLKEQMDTGSANEALSLSGVDVSIGALNVFGRVFKDLRVGGTRAGAEWQIDLRGRELTGSAHWQAAASGRPNGRLVARLQQVTAPPTAATPGASSAPRIDAPLAANPWPALDIVAESFTVRNHELGKLELLAQPRDADWRIEKLKLSSDDGALTANGWWRNSRATQQTELEFDLDVRDAEQYLARFGVPGGPRRAPTQLRGQLTWAGSPLDFNHATLSGAFSLETGPGQFTQVDPGIGKLLGILSLQAIRRRLAGDYQDLFGQGFVFDEITGKMRIKDGVIRTDDLRISGPSARVTIAGDADVAHETQNLSVRVQPTLSGTVSLGAAALMLANPLIGAAIGAGSYLAQAIMQDPIEQMFSQRYMVTGSWADPQVERGSAVAARPGIMGDGK